MPTSGFEYTVSNTGLAPDTSAWPGVEYTVSNTGLLFETGPWPGSEFTLVGDVELEIPQNIEVWDGDSWEPRPLRYWNGRGWVSAHPLHYYDDVSDTWVVLPDGAGA
jgi:hypothetical protein